LHSDGVLSDPSGDLVIKPCTPAEVAFYELVNASYPDLANFMPRFMGTLQHNTSVSEATSGLSNPPPDSAAASVPPPIAGLKLLNIPATHPPSSSIPGTDPTLLTSDASLLKGRKLDTELHIVLENVAAKFKKPNILDLKLGSRLWADDAKPEKRARLDKVSGETTSGSLGFRIAGMRVWQGKDKVIDGVDKFSAEAQKMHELDEESNYINHNKLYGRHFKAENVIEGFKKYLHVPHAGIGKKQAHLLAQLFLEEIKEMQLALEAHETRMYSSSILLVYEGHGDAFREAREILSKPVEEENAEQEDSDGAEDEDEDEDTTPGLYAVRLIDFAHASFTPGLGPDENMLQGVRSTVRILEQLVEEYDE
jgi:1D-myo-inositol-tetrakisphosphate 5-kinase/inositol-polyphosphate multikinase